MAWLTSQTGLMGVDSTVESLHKVMLRAGNALVIKSRREDEPQSGFEREIPGSVDLRSVGKASPLNEEFDRSATTGKSSQRFADLDGEGAVPGIALRRHSRRTTRSQCSARRQLSRPAIDYRRRLPTGLNGRDETFVADLPDTIRASLSVASGEGFGCRELVFPRADRLSLRAHPLRKHA